VKELTFLYDADGVIKKKLKPDFKKLGPKLGKEMKAVTAVISALDAGQIGILETNGSITLNVNQNLFEITTDEVEVLTEDIPGSLVATEAGITVALDVTLDQELIEEGIARDLVNRIQNIRKESGFEITDRIHVSYKADEEVSRAIQSNLNYICAEILADTFNPVSGDQTENGTEVELGEQLRAEIFVYRV
jgi:isoleucyl-tRNA synthetase